MASKVLVSHLIAESSKHCKYCAKEFKSQVSRQKHERELHVVKKEECTVCQKECLSALALRNHMKSHQIKTCDNCNKAINMNNFSRHLNACKGIIKKVSPKTLEDQKLRDNKQVECPNCFKEFSWVQSLRRHMKTCEGTKVIKKFKCPLCPKSYTKKQSQTRHVTISH